MILHGGLHLIWEALAKLVEGADRPSVFRLSLRVVALGAISVCGGAGVVGTVGRGVLIAALVLLANVGCLGGASSGGSLGGGWPSSSDWVLGGEGSSVRGKGLHGACLCRERLRSVRLSSPSWKSSISLLLVGVIRRRRMLAMFR